MFLGLKHAICHFVSSNVSTVGSFFSELFYGGVPGQAAVIHNAVAEATG